MSRRLFVCHAHAEIESTSEIVDALESALDFPASALWTSSLPGYSTDETSLRDKLADTAIVLALVSNSSARDPHFSFELGAAWSLHIRVVLVVLGELDNVFLPASLRDAPIVRSHNDGEWSELIGDLSLRLGLTPRSAALRMPTLIERTERQERQERIEPTIASVTPIDAWLSQPTAAELAQETEEDQPEREEIPTHSYIQELLNIEASRAEAMREAEEAEEETSAYLPSAAPAIDELSTTDFIESPDLGIPDYAAAISEASYDPPDYVEPDTLRVDFAQPSQTDHDDDQDDDDQDDDELTPDELEDHDDDFEDHEPAQFAKQSKRSSTSDVFARLPGCAMALEAGRAVSDCAFNREEIENFEAEVGGQLGPLINGLGGSWDELREEQDFEGWVSTADTYLRSLPEEARKIEDWYRVGYELATLHNLAGQLTLDGTDAAAEQHWRGALERFLMRAERAEIGYENLGKVLGLLENLAGPSGERDLANIGRSLEELRRYAAGADAIHTAAE